ncbi:MAG: hypothetical protein QF411_05335, partial [Planctomycetota bacterium]|nr:hypothetical protein [Planctomycetota bacterium]
MEFLHALLDHFMQSAHPFADTLHELPSVLLDFRAHIVPMSIALAAAIMTTMRITVATAILPAP